MLPISFMVIAKWWAIVLPYKKIPRFTKTFDCDVFKALFFRQLCHCMPSGIHLRQPEKTSCSPDMTIRKNVMSLISLNDYPRMYHFLECFKRSIRLIASKHQDIVSDVFLNAKCWWNCLETTERRSFARRLSFAERGHLLAEGVWVHLSSEMECKAREEPSLL
jgi:hypothetical protein